jgi:hypothetical protein
MSAVLLAELGYSAEKSPSRSTPPSPDFGRDPPPVPTSPDYCPSEDSYGRERSYSPARHALEEDVTDLRAELAELKPKFARLRNRVIYLEGEIAVYQRFAVIQTREEKVPPLPQPQPPPRQFHYYRSPPPPPPPRGAVDAHYPSHF